jgi:hypothetical protein
MRYVTYDEDGNLTGCYMQDLHPDHANCYFEVPESIVINWVSYRMNAARDGIELIS